MRNVNIECDEQQTGPINVIVLQALVIITNRILTASVGYKNVTN